MDMAAITRISLEEYFQMYFEGECELVNGELRPKPAGAEPHSRIQARLVRFLMRFEQSGAQALPELNLRFRNNTVLIPDVVFTRPRQRLDRYGSIGSPPLLCIEVLFPSQSFAALYEKCLRYLRWGVPYCWIIDPVKQLVWQIERDEAPREAPPSGSLHAGEIEIKLVELFQ